MMDLGIARKVVAWSTLRKRGKPIEDSRVQDPEPNAQVESLDHRAYVGGLWEKIGRLQFEFLLRQGLARSDCLLDIACGSLRGGVHFINYLNPGNYLGIEKQRRLVELGIEKELGRAVFLKQKPEFVFSGDFEFHRFSKIPSYSIAQSLLTHLVPSDIHTCLRNLRAFVKDGHVAFATFFEGDSSCNSDESHPHKCFHYSVEEMDAFGRRVGWKPTCFGNWDHPIDQVMILLASIYVPIL